MDQALLDGGYRCYTGEKIDVYFNTAICQLDWPHESPDNQYHLNK